MREAAGGAIPARGRTPARGERRLGDDGKVDVLAYMSRPPRRVDRATRRTMGRGLRPAAGARSHCRGSRRLIAGVAGKHEAVDDERVVAGLEQLGEPNVGGGSVRSGPLGRRSRASTARGRELAPGGGDRLHRPAQLDLSFQQPIAGSPVLRWLPRKGDADELSSCRISRTRPEPQGRARFANRWTRRCPRTHR